ncbi:hypothetical protein B6U98_05820 [Thermoplasmatales archaeon ex4572_165]|nr:MAG: hypothetical protein B6U98_05820 [Thermoplasmatales archaeon ex4572_165]RLF59215.1 MAG: hypothetical protein DRN27_03250 [Thermoplasmata archaeon]
MPSNSVEKAKNHVKKLFNQDKISKKNAEYILEFADRLSAKDFSDNRQRKYLYVLSKLVRIYGKDFDKATRKDMNNLASIIREKYNGETPRDYLVILRIFLRYVRDPDGKKYRKNEFPDEVSDIEPGSRKYKKMLPTELLTLDEVKNIAEKSGNLRDRCFVLLLYETGCRIGELIGNDFFPGVLLKHIENDKHGVIITVIGKTGSRKLRVIASAPAINNWLLEHPDRKNKNASLFCGIWTNRGKRIQYRYWNKMLKEVGKIAGIDKPMNPHHFRHSRASELANFMTESQLCQYMGWEQGSKQTRTYVHLRDTDSAILAMHGIEEDKKKQSKFNPIECPRCKIKNDPSAKFCSQCSLGLDEKSVMEYDERKEDATKTGFNIMELLKDPDFVIKFGNQLAEEYGKIKKKNDG